MSHREEAAAAFDDQNRDIWPAVASPAQLAPENARQRAEVKDAETHSQPTSGKYLSIDEVADEIGGLPEEIREWTESGAIVLVDAASARSGRVCEEDFRRIERYQIAVDIRRCFKDPERFLDTRFERFGDKTPRDLLASDYAGLVRDLVWQVKSGAN